MEGNLKTTAENFESITDYQKKPQSNLRWDLVFTLPAWMQNWWLNFGSGSELYLRSIKQGDNITGIAPLKIREGQASFIGSENVCDYMDFITVPGHETEFFDAVLDDLRQQGLKELKMETVRPDSSVVQILVPMAQKRGWKVTSQQIDVSLDMSLPRDFQSYLVALDGKQRHELRRKMRNLQDAGKTEYRVIQQETDFAGATDIFLQLFPDYRQDKAEFLTAEMQAYFRSLTNALAKTGILRYGQLEIEKKIVAMIMYFDYNNNAYLYNSAYAPEYKPLSVGIISKVNCIEDSIEKGKTRFDFLKGNEQYKYYLGGKEIPLYSCLISLQ
jgi:CelD/BcsL family acetyltransferase involved in cellulose biosynthesis